ncbi:WhiB family transcriptional regulator [Streptomyces anandii]|uniref:WhiB family transcriptional regulator n=1 Tax=Streptomyces anandii TaxID=285454 RepID=UPI0036A5C822
MSTPIKDGESLWQDEAKCANIDVSEFFERATEREAKRLCKMCPVQGDCLEYALVYDMYGVWGGMSYNERKRKYSSDYRQMLREDLKDSGLYNERLKA